MHVWSKLSSAKWRDAWEERFLGLGQTNAVISELPGGKSVRVDVYCENEGDALAIQEQFGGRVRKLKDENWAAMAPPQRNPIKIRDMLLITGEGDAGKLSQLRVEHPGREVISIPAELAFGTGDHATTATCLRVLADVARAYRGEGRGWSMLDLGSGTGLLAIAAHKLGASRVEGFGFDPTAVKVARRNLERNGAEGVEIAKGDVFDWAPVEASFDVVAANVFADVLCPNMAKIASATKPGGHWILSGILREHEELVQDAIDSAGLEAPRAIRRGKWVTLHGRR